MADAEGLISGRAESRVDYEPEANAAAITFGPFPKGSKVIDLPVMYNGELHAIITFVEGRLVEMQLLDARQQMQPGWFGDD